MRRRIPSALAALAVAASAIALAGCTQIAAIAPVGGDGLAEVRFAVADVLVREQVDLLVAPVCTQEPDATIDCLGESIDGDEIVATAPGDDLDAVSITVGGETLYAGSIMDVLETAMEPTG